ncbi:hypothetical protein TcCL_NonESM04587 [Trypanosoma cruzi]|nr:hypothetical protein TcCL_NonESM04587 [Trypanosoma cruzi]
MTSTYAHSTSNTYLPERRIHEVWFCHSQRDLSPVNNKKQWPRRSSSEGRQSGQTRVGTRHHTKKEGNDSSRPRNRAVFISLFLNGTSSTEKMQQTHVQHNISLSRVPS